LFCFVCFVGFGGKKEREKRKDDANLVTVKQICFEYFSPPLLVDCPSQHAQVKPDKYSPKTNQSNKNKKFFKKMSLVKIKTKKPKKKT